jgi:uncharacterized protein (TIGR02391 family)
MEKMVPRPLTKELLKKMFLKTLWETRKGGKLKESSSGVGSILHSHSGSLAWLFKLPNLQSGVVRPEYRLTDKERMLAFEGVEELQRDGYLMNEPGRENNDFKILTEKGRKVVEQELTDMKLPSVDIEKVLSRPVLLNLVKDNYLNGRYDSAIRDAFLLVEEVVRAKARQAPNVVGHNLMAAAFSPGNRVLTHPDAKTVEEERGMFFLFAGANGWFRNPTAHRTVGYEDPHEVAQILALANLLLDIVDKCV